MDNGGLFYIPGEGFSSQYNEGAYELSVSQVISLLTSEYLIAILMIPLSMFGLMRKSRRYKKVRRKLERTTSSDELKGAEEAIDEMIVKKQVKIEHGMLLRNLYERKAVQMKKRDSNKVKDWSGPPGVSNQQAPQNPGGSRPNSQGQGPRRY